MKCAYCTVLVLAVGCIMLGCRSRQQACQSCGPESPYAQYEASPHTYKQPSASYQSSESYSMPSYDAQPVPTQELQTQPTYGSSTLNSAPTYPNTPSPGSGIRTYSPPAAGSGTRVPLQGSGSR
jgi:hypothetical protein